MHQLLLFFMQCAYEHGIMRLIDQQKLMDTQAALIEANDKLMTLGYKPCTPRYLKKES